jgi:ABC-2 type transport system ATP-binding protein
MPEDEIVIRVENVSKNFVLPHEKVSSIKSLFTGVTKSHNKGKETQHALKDISFEIKKGEFFGIVGRNGSGKSTLLKILAGIYQPTVGQVSTIGKLVPFIELGVGFNPELTGRENVYLNGAMLGFTRKEINAMYQDIVSFAELSNFMDQKLKNYSSGMQVRLAFSMATRAKADILLIDEVLAVGDADFQRKCFNYFRKLKRNKKTVVFVSHDMDAVREYCDRAVMIEKSELIASGDPESVASKYTRMFIEESKDDQTSQSEEKSNRWGTKTVIYKDAKVEVNDDEIVLKIEAEARELASHANFGFSIKGATGQVILGTNSQIKKTHIEELPKGSKIYLSWRFPNIFKDDEYTLDLAAISKNGEVWDWWEGAKTFKVFKEEKTPYKINPQTSLEVRVEK